MNDTVNFIVGTADGRSMELNIPSGYTLDEMMVFFELIITFLGYEPLRLDWEYLRPEKDNG